MATSRCPRSDCASSSFEIKELKVRDARFRMNAVQCSSCGAVVGIRDFQNVPELLDVLATKLGVGSL
jgi:hypothetical protein